MRQGVRDFLIIAATAYGLDGVAAQTIEEALECTWDLENTSDKANSIQSQGTKRIEFLTDNSAQVVDVGFDGLRIDESKRTCDLRRTPTVLLLTDCHPGGPVTIDPSDGVFQIEIDRQNGSFKEVDTTAYYDHPIAVDRDGVPRPDSVERVAKIKFVKSSGQCHKTL